MAAHRYWRLWLLASNYGSATSFAETQFRTTPGTPLLFSNAANASAGSAYGGIPGTYDGSHAADNNPSTLWAGSAGFPDWWQYDYGAGNALDIKEVTITARNDAVPEQTPSSFTLQYSDDNSAFTNVQTFTAATWSLGQTQVFTVAAAPGFVDLAGNLAPSTTLAANLTVIGATVDLAAGLTPSWAFAANLTIVSAAGNYVDFAGNLGSPSAYGKLSYGELHYSRISAFQPIFAADFTLVGQAFFGGDLRPTVTFNGALGRIGALAGDLRPTVTFGGVLTVPAYVDFAGNLSPQVSFGASLTETVSLSGDLAPQIALGGSLGLLLQFTSYEGGLSFDVVLGASSMISGPLWGEEVPVQPPWGPSEPCPPSLWTPVEPCDPVDWEETELCRG